MTDDFISRQAAINTVFSMCCRWDTDDQNDLKNMLLTAFQDLPAAQETKDAVEVVRCKDCKHHECVEKPGMVYCAEVLDGWVGEDFFCKRGERGEDDTE